MRYAIIAILFAVYVVLGCPIWMATQEMPFALRAAIYPLFHSNIFHLLVNCMSVWFVFSPRNRHNLTDLVLAFIVSFAVYGMSRHPIVGISNIIFTIIGLRSPSFDNPWWRNRNTLIFLGTNMMMALMPHVSGLTHIVSFLAGVTLASIRRRIKLWSGR